MTAEQFIRRDLRMYQRLEQKKRAYADASDDILCRAKCLAEAAVYSIAADDMREILDCAEDIKRPVGAATPASLPRDDGFCRSHHPGE